MLRAEKETVLADLKERLAGSQSVVLTDYRGLPAADLGGLRHELRAAGVEFHVVKNSLLERALAEIDVDTPPEFGEALAGPTAIAYTTGEEMTLPMKLVHESGKDHEALQIKGGFLEGRFVATDEVEELAKLPDRAELMAMVAGAVQSPVAGVVGVLNALLGGLVSGIDQIAQQKEESGEASP